MPNFEDYLIKHKGTVSSIAIQTLVSAFSETRLPLELWRVLSCESPAVFLHFSLEEKGPLGPLLSAPAKGRHLLQVLLQALLVYFVVIFVLKSNDIGFIVI